VEAALKESSTQADLIIVGGGINGVGIARDAAGRGLRAILVEQGDLGSATSSASSKLIHGGLRYLEQLEFKLVAEALAEREVLLNAAPHIVRPMRFVMPHARDLRPGWMIRAGLFLYDWLARRQTLAPSRRADLAAPPYAGAFKPGYTRGYAYSDCWVDDARLVIANARAAAEAGAAILPRTKCVSATRDGALWRATLVGDGGETHVEARALVNAAGPWVDRFLAQTLGGPAQSRVKLVQGSHIVVPRLYEGGHACLLQNDDRRVVFAYPYESRYTLVGTTDVELPGEPGSCGATPEEIAYLCRAANRYFLRTIDPGDVKWSYCGVRALVDDGSRNPSQLTRDYLLRLDGAPSEAPLLSVFGGKITTYRRLAERALERLAPWFPQAGEPWTATARLPGGEIPDGDLAAYSVVLGARYPALPPPLVAALARRHGSRVPDVLADAGAIADLGPHFGGDLYGCEVDYFQAQEWARSAEDVLWRRTKAGLHLDLAQQADLCRYMTEQAEGPMR
jgi:glycerol-3-phosphate dehydrogenase